MGDAGFFRGTSSDQDGRFSDKEKKLLKQMKFENTLDRKINMDKINLDVIKPWITMRINEILGIEDDVVIEYIMSQLEEKTINPKIMQINITGFLNARRAREFMGELWMLLVEADEAEDGIPRSLLEKKIDEMRKEPRPSGNGDAKPEPTPQSADWATRYSSLSGGRYTGPTKEKEVPDDRITKVSPRGGTPPRQRRNNAARDDTPPRRRVHDDRERDRERDRDRDRDRDRERDKEREQRRQQRIEDERRREEESKKREEDRLKRRAEERERERRKDEERAKERERRRAEEREREKRRRRSRSRSRSRSPVKRRFTEGTSSSKRKRSPSSSSDEDSRKKKRSSKRKYRSSDEDSEYERKKKDKKSKKHKKEKKKKERKRSPTPSSSSLSDTE